MKVIFFTGGVYSSIGKGIVISSTGTILQELGFQVEILKFDPYLNVDSGQLSPGQHGEVYVTSDGKETDLDLGHYERFLNLKVNKNSCVTAGKIYWELLNQERTGFFQGKTVQIKPHLIDAINNKILEIMKNNSKCDFLLIEIGGTVGDAELTPFLLAAKNLSTIITAQNIMFIHLVPVLFINHAQEFKTKPAQHSIANLQSLGINPNLLIIKSNKKLENEVIKKITDSAYISKTNIINSIYQKSIYVVPNFLYEHKMHEKILNYFNMNIPNKNLNKWIKFTTQIEQFKKHKLELGIVGKYARASDSYLSIIESFKLAAYKLEVDLKIHVIDSDSIKDTKELEKLDLMCVPYGFGERGVEGKMLAIKYTRERKIPFLGICYGMQVACLEFAKNVLNLKEANTVENDKNTDFPIFIKQNPNAEMRLGDQEIKIKSETLAQKIYNSAAISVRHRHKYIFNPAYIKQYEDNGFIFSGFSNDENNIVEIMEMKDHPFFIGVQYHPEFDSNPFHSEPLFIGILKAAINKA